MCPNNEEYKTIGVDPEDTCVRASEVEKTFSEPKCVCIDGYVRTDPKGPCIPKSECPRGKYIYIIMFRFFSLLPVKVCTFWFET